MYGPSGYFPEGPLYARQPLCRYWMSLRRFNETARMLYGTKRANVAPSRTADQSQGRITLQRKNSAVTCRVPFQ